MSQYSFPPCDLPPGTPVVASVRVSPGPHQDLDAQRDYIIEFCKFYQLVLVKVFEDRAKSGGSVVGRDGLVAMMEFVLSQPIESVKAVIFYHTSRLARDMADAQQTSAMFRQSGREVLYLQNPIPSGSVGPLIESVFFYTDQQYRETLREQVVNGQMRIRGLKDANGDYLGVYGGRTPFGFLQERIDIGITRNNGEKRILTVIKPDPALAPKILQAFQLRAAGWTYREIENETHLFNYPENICHDERMRLINLYKGMFNRPIYKGDYEYNQRVYLKRGENQPPGVELHTIEKINPLNQTPIRRQYWVNKSLYPNFVEAIVPVELWKDVQQKQWIDNKRTQASTGLVEHVKSGSSELMLLSGLLYCAHCGKLMYARVFKYKATDTIYRNYLCSTCTRFGKDACSIPSARIRGIGIESAVINYIFSTFLSADFVMSLVERVNELLNDTDEEKIANDLQSKIRKLDQQRQNLLNLVTEGDGDAEARYRVLTREKHELEAKLNTHKLIWGDNRPLRVTINAVNDKLAELRDGLDVQHIHHKRAMLQQLLTKVETGFNETGGQFANITFNADNLINTSGLKTGFSTQCYYLMKQKFT